MCEKICSILLIKYIKDYRGSQGQCKIRILEKKVLQANIIAMVTLEVFLYMLNPIFKNQWIRQILHYKSLYSIGHVPDYPGAG